MGFVVFVCFLELQDSAKKLNICDADSYFHMCWPSFNDIFLWSTVLSGVSESSTN